MRKTRTVSEPSLEPGVEAAGGERREQKLNSESPGVPRSNDMFEIYSEGYRHK